MHDSKLSLINLQAISLILEGRIILDKISLNLAKGEILTLIGPNGAGKSTLAKIILGLIKPTNGRINRQDNLTIGYVPQKFVLNPLLPITAKAFVKLTKNLSDQKVNEQFNQLGITYLSHYDLSQLSGGELQRVLLARALTHHPDLLVLDEPTQGIDFSGQTDFYQLITEIRDKRNCSIFIISHDLHVVMAATDRVICLNKHICCSGLPDTVQQHPEYEALFGQHAAKRLAIYAHHHDHTHHVDGDVKQRKD